jgi:hypothetical protein
MSISDQWRIIWKRCLHRLRWIERRDFPILSCEEGSKETLELAFRGHKDRRRIGWEL